MTPAAPPLPPPPPKAGARMLRERETLRGLLAEEPGTIILWLCSGALRRGVRSGGESGGGTAGPSGELRCAGPPRAGDEEAAAGSPGSGLPAPAPAPPRCGEAASGGVATGVKRMPRALVGSPGEVVGAAGPGPLSRYTAALHPCGGGGRRRGGERGRRP